MSSLIDDMKFKSYVSALELVKFKLGNGNIAIGLQMKDTAHRVILKEFRGDWQYRKFIIEAILLRNIVSPQFKELKKINSTLLSFKQFLEEKIENEKNII